MEADERDRLKEREELDEIRKKLLEEGHPDPDSEMERVKLIFIFFCVPLLSLMYLLSSRERETPQYNNDENQYSSMSDNTELLYYRSHHSIHLWLNGNR